MLIALVFHIHAFVNDIKSL